MTVWSVMAMPHRSHVKILSKREIDGLSLDADNEGSLSNRLDSNPLPSINDDLAESESFSRSSS